MAAQRTRTLSSHGSRDLLFFNSLCLLKLTCVEFVVEALLFHEFVVGTLFDYVPVVQDQDVVRVLDGGEAVRDDKAGLSGHQAAHGLLYPPLCICVDV